MPSGCGSGGTVAWTNVIPYDPANGQVSPGDIAGGPLGHVALGTTVTGYGNNGPVCYATGYVWDATGAAMSATMVSYTDCGSASLSPVAFDTADHLLYAYTRLGPSGGGTTGFVGESVNTTFQAAPYGMGPHVGATFLGADAAGNFFVQATTGGTPTTSVDFGLGPVSGTVMLHYDPSGNLVSDSLPTGVTAVGALGDLFYAAQVSGTTDQGCGTVGTAGVTSTVLTERDTTGTCTWSKALPASTLIAVDPSQNVLLATTFSGTIDFGGGPLTSVGTSDLAIAELDPSGNLLWSKSFGASGASVSGIKALGATTSGGLAIAAGMSGAVDFGCGTIGGASGATTLIANFDAKDAVIYSRVVQLQASIVPSLLVADGLGGISYAAQVPYEGSSCTCTSDAQCGNSGFPPPACVGGMCQPCPPVLDEIVVTRFAP